MGIRQEKKEDKELKEQIGEQKMKEQGENNKNETIENEGKRNQRLLQKIWNSFR